VTHFESLAAIGSRDRIHVVIETPKGATAKFKYETRLGAFKYVRPLREKLAYPFDWGFVPSTAAADGDPLDAMVLHDDVTFPGAIIPCRAIGILEVQQREKGRTFRNDRVIFVPSIETRPDNLPAAIRRLSRLRKKLERFFKAAVAGTGKELTYLGWKDERAATEAVKKAITSYRRKHRR
jgi:inorganic pyrophosphatase